MQLCQHAILANVICYDIKSNSNKYIFYAAVTKAFAVTMLTWKIRCGNSWCVVVTQIFFFVQFKVYL